MAVAAKVLILRKEVGLTEQLRRGGAGSLGAKCIEVCLGLLLAILLARLLGASGYGVYAFVFALASLASVPGLIGLPPLVVRETARGEIEGAWGVVRGVWCWANAVALGLSLLVFAAGLLALGLGSVQEQPLRDTFFLGLFLVPLLALAAIRSASLRGLRQVLAGIVPEQVVRPALMVLFLLGVMAWSSAELSPADAMGLMLVATLVAFLLGALLLRRYRPLAVATARPEIHGRTWFRAAWPMGLTQGFQQLNRYADVILLGILAVAADVGVYRVAAQGALLVSLGLTALNMVIGPFFARLYANEERQELQKLARRTAQAALGLGIPAFVLFALYGEWLLVTLFGPEFAGSYWPLLILASGQLANAGFGATGMLLNMTGHERDVTRVVAGAVGLNVALNLALIPLFGVIGAALATSVSLAFWNVWLWWLVQVRLGIRCSAI